MDQNLSGSQIKLTFSYCLIKSKGKKWSKTPYFQAPLVKQKITTRDFRQKSEVCVAQVWIELEGKSTVTKYLRINWPFVFRATKQVTQHDTLFNWIYLTIEDIYCVNFNFILTRKLLISHILSITWLKNFT